MSNQKLELNWIGKGEAPALEPRILLLQPEYCHGDPQADNMLIHGDNLLALKALEQQYAGKVKCIYIDPPYNTGNAFEHYDDMMEHSLWLNLMYHRLVALRKLLSEDGSIWISIDDDECHYLKVMCDEVFGRKNFVNNVIWEKKFSPQNDAKWLSDSHDHILVFAKNKEIWRPNLLPRSEKQTENLKNPDNDPRGPWLSVDYTCAKSKQERPNLFYAISNPFTGEEIFPSETRVWAFDKKGTEENVCNDLMFWGIDGRNKVPRLKKFIENVRQGTVSKTIWQNDEVGNTQEAKRETLAFDKENVFATPKPERLIQRIITLATNPNDLVLDSFLGSGTTAAVAHKMGRRWIGIELGEHAHTHCVPRLRKVVSGEDQGGISKAVGWQGGGGFKTYRLAPSLLKTDEHEMLRFNPEYTDAMIAEAVSKIEGFTFAPDPAVFWKQARSSERDFLFVTKIFVTREWLAQLHEQMAPEESLLLCCPAYGEGCERAFANINLKKIPAAFVHRYEFGKEDYSLKISNLPGNPETSGEEGFEFEETLEPGVLKKKKGKSGAATDGQPTLF